jgi:hypothetical protein
LRAVRPQPAHKVFSWFWTGNFDCRGAGHNSVSFCFADYETELP